MQNSTGEDGRGLKVMKRRMTAGAGRTNWTRKGVMIAVHVKSSANCWMCPAMRMQGEGSTAAADVTVNGGDGSLGRVYYMRK